ncbi:MAG TPA: nodulation protein NfeD, partial [Firmicutes bacterium]|nr:nodulation protein NfeD [Bacillota bacterium]
MRLAVPAALVLLGALACPAPAQQEATAERQAIAYVIPIESEIFKGLIHPVRRGIEEAEAAGASVIIFELETPGGAVDTAMEIKS